MALRIERHEMWVAEVDAAVALFAETSIEADRVTLVAIYADPARRGMGLGTAVLDAIVAAHPDLPIAADVLVGNERGETFYARAGSCPARRSTSSSAPSASRSAAGGWASRPGRRASAGRDPRADR